jgi:ABC-type glycerol-3-phosphate transport system substrate-binding protein
MKGQMRPFTRRDFLRLTAVTAAGALAAACGGAPATEAPKAEAPQAEPTKAPEQPAPAPAAGAVALRLWSHNNPAFVKTNEALVTKYQEANPNVTVKYENFPYDEFIQTIQTSMAAKNEADVMEMFGSWVQSYAKGGTLAIAPDAVMSMSGRASCTASPTSTTWRTAACWSTRKSSMRPGSSIRRSGRPGMT